MTRKTPPVDPEAEMATDRPDVTEASSTVDAGVLKIEAVQRDIRTGMALNDAAADWFTGTGMAIRFR